MIIFSVETWVAVIIIILIIKSIGILLVTEYLLRIILEETKAVIYDNILSGNRPHFSSSLASSSSNVLNSEPRMLPTVTTRSIKSTLAATTSPVITATSTNIYDTATNKTNMDIHLDNDSNKLYILRKIRLNNWNSIVTFVDSTKKNKIMRGKKERRIMLAINSMAAPICVAIVNTIGV